MTSDRSQAYGRVVRTLDELGPAKLLPAEQDAIRQSADALLFATTLETPGVREALEDTTELLARLVESARWTQESADALAEDLGECGPLSGVAR